MWMKCRVSKGAMTVSTTGDTVVKIVKKDSVQEFDLQRWTENNEGKEDD